MVDNASASTSSSPATSQTWRSLCIARQPVCHLCNSSACHPAKHCTTISLRVPCIETDKQQNNRVTVPSLALVPGRDMTLVLLLLVAAVSTVHGQDKPTARLSMSINRDPPLTKGGNMTIVCSVATILTPWREMSSMDMTPQPEQPLLSAKKGQGKNYRRTFHNSARYNILQSDGVVFSLNRLLLQNSFLYLTEKWTPT